MLRTRLLLIAIAILTTSALTLAPVIADTWDAAAQFNTVSYSGTWNYGYAATGIPSSYSFTPLTYGTVFRPGEVNEGWSWFKDATSTNNQGDHAPGIGLYTKTSTFWVFTPPTAVWLFPCDAVLSTGECPILRWTAPADGNYDFTGTLTAGNNGHQCTYYVVKHSASPESWSTLLTGIAKYTNAPVSLIGAWNGMKAGDSFDIIVKSADFARPLVKLALVVSNGENPGIKGYVQNASGSRIVGATVTCGSTTVTTGSDGTYSITTGAPGTYSITASMLGYDTITYPSVVVGGGMATQDFTLPTGAIVSGTVTENTPAQPAIPGVTITTMDGLYSASTDSAGHYSLQVTHGNYDLRFYKQGYGVKVLPLAASSSATITLSAALDQGWDLAADFTTANPNSPWTLGYIPGSSYSQTAFIAFGATGFGGWWSQAYDQWWHATRDQLPPYGDPWNESPAFVKNTGYVPVATTYNAPMFYREPLKVTATTDGLATNMAVARFVAPTSGYYRLTAKWAGAAPDTFAQPSVGIVQNGIWLFGGPGDPKQINGFVGRAANGYSDSAGVDPVFTYSTTTDVFAGDVFDSVLYGGGGYAQVDLTLTKEPTTVTGRVIASNMPGNLPLPGALVYANGGSTYTTTTDSAGYYTLSVRPDTYEMVTQAPGYTPQTIDTLVVADNAFVTQNFSLSHKGIWNLANDFSSVANPAYQWSYGFVDTTADYTFTPHARVYTNIAGANVPIWSGPGYNHPQNVWFDPLLEVGAIGKNTSLIQTAEAYDNHILSQEISFIGGGRAEWWPVVRWTAPDTRLVKIHYQIKGQYSKMLEIGSPATYVTPTYPVTIAKNGSSMVTKVASGFAGRLAAGYTDSIGPFSTPTFETTIPVVAGDTIDFGLGKMDQYPYGFGWPFRGVALTATVTTTTDGAIVNSIPELKSKSAGTMVFMTTAMMITSTTGEAWSFDKKYGSPGTPEYSFFIQNDDRTQGIKCIHDGTLPIYQVGYKVEFSGLIETDTLGQKVVRVTSINRGVSAPLPKPMGKTSKGLANTATLVKIWGKITRLEPNPNAWSDLWDQGSGSMVPKYTYEYIVIDDGGVSGGIKIPMHVQFNYMTGGFDSNNQPYGDPTIRDLAVGDYIAVTGIAGTTTGSDVVVYPRNVADILEYAP